MKQFVNFTEPATILLLTLAILLVGHVEVVQAQTLIAHYPLSSDANDLTGQNSPMTLTNTPFQDGGIYCNGLYIYGGDPDHCDATTPYLSDFDFESFSVTAKFKLQEFPSSDRPVFIAHDRWVGFYLRNDSTVTLKYNNSNRVYSSVRYSIDVWHEATITYSGGVGKLYLDGKFVVSVPFEPNHDNDSRIGITDFSNGGVFKGILKDLMIYKDIPCSPAVVATNPLPNLISVPVDDSISATWADLMDMASINDVTFRVNARSTGLHGGSFSAVSDYVALELDEPFAPGELVTVTLSNAISCGGSSDWDGYSWQFFTSTAPSPGTFSLETIYPGGNGNEAIVAADFDGNGNIDLATSDRWRDSVSVYLGNGDGTFSSHVQFPTGEGPRSIHAADLDGDGIIDLITADGLADSISVLIGNGDGSFTSHTQYPVGNNPMSVYAADLDGDGDLDLITANLRSDDVSVLLGEGNGSFAPKTAYPVGENPEGVVAADLDGDGVLDLATCDSKSDSISVLMGNGDGSFAARSAYAAGDCPWKIFAGDLDSDGDLDLATADYLGGSVSVFLGNGDGTFAPLIQYPAGNGPRDIFGGDFDGDGDLDLAIGQYYSSPNSPSSICILSGAGDGSFPTSTQYQTGEYNSPRSVCAADFDGDGDLDLATGNSGVDKISILLNGNYCLSEITTDPLQNAMGVPVDASIGATFSETMDAGTMDNTSFVIHGRSTGQHFGTIVSGSSEVLLDPDHNFAHGEVVTATLTKSTYCQGGLHIQNGFTWQFGSEVVPSLGTFSTLSEHHVGNSPTSVCAVDLNRDGVIDLVSADSQCDSISILMGEGGGSFSFHTQFGVGSNPVSVCAVDLDGDGHLDLATADQYDNSVSVLLGDGFGGFAPRAAYPVGSGPESVLAADLDGDGALDLVTSDNDADSISILLGIGDGSFNSHKGCGGGYDPRSVIAVDLSNDGDLDLIATERSENRVWLLRNNGDGSFPVSAYMTGMGPDPSSAVTGDFNGDGIIDLAVANDSVDSITVALGRVNGNFGGTTRYAVEGGPTLIYTGDLDGDGDLDLVTGNISEPSSHTVSVLLGNGDSSFVTPTTYPMGEREPTSIFLADLDGDGDLDLAVTSINANVVTILYNDNLTCCKGLTGNIDNDPEELIDLGDLTKLIDYLFISFIAPVCIEEANVDGDVEGLVDLGDLTSLIDYLFISFTAPAVCL